MPTFLDFYVLSLFLVPLNFQNPLNQQTNLFPSLIPAPNTYSIWISHTKSIKCISLSIPINSWCIFDLRRSQNISQVGRNCENKIFVIKLKIQKILRDLLTSGYVINFSDIRRCCWNYIRYNFVLLERHFTDWRVAYSSHKLILNCVTKKQSSRQHCGCKLRACCACLSD